MLRGVGVVLRDEGFRIAFVVAAVGTLGALWTTRRSLLPIGFALVAVVAALVALRAQYDLDVRFVIGLALLGLAWVIDRAAPLLRLVGLIGGAWLVVGELSGLPGWMQAVGFAAMVGAAPLAVSLDRTVPRVMPLLVLLSVGGIYECAPDTEISKVLLGAVTPVVVLALEPRLRSSAVIASLAGLMVWVAVLEGQGRPGAVVGSIACLGVIVVAPLVRWRASSLRSVLLLLATQAALVLYVSRVAGFRHSAWAALALCLPAFALAWFVLLVVNRRAAG
jgi:hypothetical protein